MDTYREFFGRERNSRESRVLTPADWSAGRSPTGFNSRYRWVEPNAEHRTKEDWPYSYSPCFLWGTPASEDSAVYSDRLHQWSSENWNRAWDVIGSKRFEQFSQEDADKFMSAYYSKPIKVSAIAEGCNVSNGYPYWILWFTNLRTRTDKLKSARSNVKAIG